MIVETYMQCPKCEKLLKEYEQTFCQNCGMQLEWLRFEEYSEYPTEMEATRTKYQGNLKCSCGQTFNFETNRSIIKCIKCGKEYDVSQYRK